MKRFSLIKTGSRVRTGRRGSESGLKRLIEAVIHKIIPGNAWNKLWGKLVPIVGNSLKLLQLFNKRALGQGEKHIGSARKKLFSLFSANFILTEKTVNVIILTD